MTIMIRKRKRADAIIAVAEEYRDEFNADASDSDIFAMIEDCTGWNLSVVERRLAIVAYNEGGKAAKKGIWYP